LRLLDSADLVLGDDHEVNVAVQFSVAERACLFASETTCQRVDRFLDRRLIVPVDLTEPQLAISERFEGGNG